MRAWARLWARLSREQRRIAAHEYLLQGEQYPEFVAASISFLAGETRNRPEVVARWSLEKRADHLSRTVGIEEGYLGGLVTTYLVKRKQPMLVRFLDVADIPNLNAVIDERLPMEAVPPARLVPAIRAIQAEFVPADVTLYLDALEAQRFPAWADLPEARRLAKLRPVDVGAAPPTPTAGRGDAEGPPPPGVAEKSVELRPAPAGSPAQAILVGGSEPFLVDSERLSALDALLTGAMVATASGVPGSLSYDRLRAVVEETIRLNAARHRSAFHLGFLDVLQGLEIDPASTQSSERARGWYVAGAVRALARRGDKGAIAGLLDRLPSDVRRLLGDRHEACGEAVESLFDALCETGRRADALASLVPIAVCRGGAPFFERLLAEATGLLRDSRAADASPLVAVLGDGLEILRRRGEVSRPGLAEEVALLRALALRLHGGFDRAAELLGPLASAAASDLSSRARSDLGLVACRIRSLSEVTLPTAVADLPSTAHALEPGRDDFQRASVPENPHRAQADFALGVLSIASGGVEAARIPLERAVSALLGGDAVAEGRGILARARLYLSVVLAESLDLGRADEALDHLVCAAETLAGELPPWLLSRALTAFATMRPDLGARAVAALYGVLGNGLLDAASGSGLLTAHDALRVALASRAESPQRNRRARAADAVALLRDALACGDLACATRALSTLEELADDAEGRARLLGLLADRTRYDPAWAVSEANDVRVRLLEAEGRYAEAAALLSGTAHEALSKDPERGLELARDLVDRIASYGIEQPDPGLAARLDAMQRTAPGPEARASRPIGRICFVGGNEVQARYEAWIREEATRRWPDVVLDFDFTGWSSNWGRSLPTIDGHIADAGAVVLMRFIRTMLGRAVREACGRHGKPWVACTGHGRDSMLAAIVRAAALLPDAAP